ncbi:hypothetical protein D3C72_1401180 [compost metagenome]
MKISGLKNGNVSPMFRAIFIVGGIAIGCSGLYFECLPRFLRAIMFVAGFFLMIIGGVSSRAGLLGIRPFEKSAWRRAKEAYKERGDE